MNKILYMIIIVFLVLTTATGLWTFVIGLRMESEIYKLPSYVSWFLLENITGFIGSVFLLKYYFERNYRVALFTGTVTFVTGLVYVAVLYAGLTSGGLESYRLPVVIVYLFALVVYAASLTFSNTRSKFWLKLAGVCGLVIGLVLISTIIVRACTIDSRIISLVGKITRWSPIAMNLVNLLFILNFVYEIKTSKTDNPSVLRQRFLAGAAALLVIVVVVFTIIIRRSIAREVDSHVDWSDLNAADARVLVGLAEGDRTFVDSDGDSLHYLLIKPMDYDKQKTYPLVVCLPYGGYEAGAAETLSNAFNRYTYRAFIFVPYCPDGEGWGGIPGTPSLASLVYETICALHDPGIDAKRRYVTGVSRGGYGTWEFICTRPDLFAAGLPVCGAGNPELALTIVNMPVWAFHGANDTNVPVSGSRDMIAAMKKAGGHPLYTEYPHGTHQIWESVSESPEVWKWLFEQRKK